MSDTPESLCPECGPGVELTLQEPLICAECGREATGVAVPKLLSLIEIGKAALEEYRNGTLPHATRRINACSDHERRFGQDCGAAAMSAAGRYYPGMPPMLPGETGEQYTDRLTGADKTGRVPYDHKRNRQCSIGYHDECSDPDGEVCQCPCHTDRPSREQP